MRIILYTGKGGVGKTTLSAATSIQAAKQGYRTLIMSTDAAHSLSDSFERELGPDPTPILDNLWGQEINVLHEIYRYWGEIQSSLSSLLITHGFDHIVADELAILPGMEEICSLLHLNEKASSGQFDCIILDCAPTGETIRFISLPDIIDWYLEKLFSISRTAGGVLKPVIKTALVLQNERIFDSIETLFGGVAHIQKSLLDAQQTSIRIVVLPERMVIKEALRSYSYFSLFGYNVDAVLLNRVVPFSEQGTFLAESYGTQQKYIQHIHDSFSPVPIQHIPLYPGEVVGIKALEEIGKYLLADPDPTAIYFTDKIQDVVKEDGGYTLTRRFSAFEKEKLDLKKKGDELLITLGNVRRSIVLPRTLALLEPQGGEFVGDKLQVRFR